jgi:putative endonuclease
MSWLLYVLECSKDLTLYTGITNNLDKRLKDHNSGRGAKYTKTRRPVRVLQTWDYPDRGTATSAERRFKKLARQKKLFFVDNPDDWER